MRIALLYSNPAIGGSETFGLSVAKVWQARHDVLIANAWNGGGGLREHAEAGAIPFAATDSCGWRSGGKGVRQLRRVLQRHRSDIILVFGLRMQLLTRGLWRHLAPHASWITMLRGLDQWRKTSHILADRWTQRRAVCHVGCSRAVCQKWIAREKYSRERVVYIPNGIDVRRYADGQRDDQLRSQLGLPAMAKVCVTVANMRAIKGYDFLADSLIHQAERFRAYPLYFLWLGESHGRWPFFEGRLRNAGLAHRVLALGPVADVRPYLMLSDLFVLPSESEGMPRALMEAMAMGLPAVVTNVGGNPEVLRHESDGLLVEHGDRDALADAIAGLASDCAKLAAMGESAKQRIAETFDVDAVCEEYVRLFACLRNASLGGVTARMLSFRATSRYNQSFEKVP